MSTSLRVHIAPIGYETLRVTKPLIEMRADKAYLVTDIDDDDNAKENFLEIKNELAEKYRHIQIEEVFLDLWSLNKCIERFRDIILSERGNSILVNVSTGSKITSIAGMLSCMLWDASPYYAPRLYSTSKKSSMETKFNNFKNGMTEMIFDSEMLPVYKINKPRLEYMQILEILKNKGPMNKSKIIEELEKIKVIRKVDAHSTEFKTTAKHSQLRALLEPMRTEWGLITVKTDGRRSQVSITEQGIEALEIFGVCP